MATLNLTFDAEFEFSPAIVWDALVDADLVSGWLAEAAIGAEEGGQYHLRWLSRPGSPESAGRITALHEPTLLVVDTGATGLLTFTLTPFAGGNRGTATHLSLAVEVDVEPVFAARVKADWLTSLDQLDDLLHGHPVDWPHWSRDRREVWSRHLAEVTGTTA